MPVDQLEPPSDEKKEAPAVPAAFEPIATQRDAEPHDTAMASSFAPGIDPEPVAEVVVEVLLDDEHAAREVLRTRTARSDAAVQPRRSGVPALLAAAARPISEKLVNGLAREGHGVLLAAPGLAASARSDGSSWRWCSSAVRPNVPGGQRPGGHHMIEVGTFLSTSPRRWAESARLLESLGFECIWIPEHVIFPVTIGLSPKTGHATPSVNAGLPAYDPWIELATMAAVTETLRFGTYTYNIGLRHPFLTARALATLDVASGGRVDLGIGSSWLREEWQAMELPFDDRGRLVDEAIDIVRRLFTEEVIEHQGEFFSFQPVGFLPKPIQDPLPLHIGGDSAVAMRRAARLGDGWCPHMQTPETLPAKLDAIAEQRADLGRSGPFQVTVQAPLETLDDVLRWEEAGVTRLLKMNMSSPKQWSEEWRRFSGEVLEQLEERP